MGRGSRLHLHLKAAVQEILEVHGHVFGLDRRPLLLGYEVHGLHGSLAHVRRVAVNHLDGQDTGAPDVHLGRVGVLVNDLWGHPIGGASERFPDLVTSNIGGKTKV